MGCLHNSAYHVHLVATRLTFGLGALAPHAAVCLQRGALTENWEQAASRLNS
jgi:hypothetical protein